MILRKIKKLRLQNPKGTTLVEVIVAIGISVITITSAAVFTGDLNRRAQENFAEVAANQLHTLMIDQLNLIEADLRNPPSKSILSTAARNLLCTQNNVPLQISFPKFDDTYTTSLNISQVLTPAYTRIVNVNGSDVNFSFFIAQEANTTPNNVRIGSYSNTPVWPAIYMTRTNDGFLNFATVVGYRVFNKDYFTTPVEIKFERSKLCS